MMYDELVSDFARRTRTNLAAIREMRNRGEEVFEVTALINSLLGLLVFPQQEYVNVIPATPLLQLQEEGWPLPRVGVGAERVLTLRKMIRYLRNAIAHCNLRFTSAPNGEIGGVVFWNENPHGVIDWKAEMSLAELDGFVSRFAEMLINPATWRK